MLPEKKTKSGGLVLVAIVVQGDGRMGTSGAPWRRFWDCGSNGGLAGVRVSFLAGARSSEFGPISGSRLLA